MICQHCQDRIASVHFTQIINNKKMEMYLCEQCAREKGDINIASNLSIQDFFSGLIGIGNIGLNNKATLKKSVCEKCGMSYEEFQSAGKLGCDQCYKVFEERLNPIIKRIHGNTEHNGKLPAEISESVSISREIDWLRSELSRSIQREEYEKAAELRDEIRKLEKSFNGG